MPKINTLVDDIYSLLENGTKSPSQEHLFAMASNIVDSMKKQLWVGTMPKGKGKLRMSNIGKPCTRSLWYDVNGDEQAEQLSPQTKLKFILVMLWKQLFFIWSKNQDIQLQINKKKLR